MHRVEEGVECAEDVVVDVLLVAVCVWHVEHCVAVSAHAAIGLQHLLLLLPLPLPRRLLLLMLAAVAGAACASACCSVSAACCTTASGNAGPHTHAARTRSNTTRSPSWGSAAASQCATFAMFALFARSLLPSASSINNKEIVCDQRHVFDRSRRR